MLKFKRIFRRLKVKLVTGIKFTSRCTVRRTSSKYPGKTNGKRRKCYTVWTYPGSFSFLLVVTSIFCPIKNVNLIFYHGTVLTSYLLGAHAESVLLLKYSIFNLYSFPTPPHTTPRRKVMPSFYRTARLSALRWRMLEVGCRSNNPPRSFTVSGRLTEISSQVCLGSFN